MKPSDLTRDQRRAAAVLDVALEAAIKTGLIDQMADGGAAFADQVLDLVERVDTLVRVLNVDPRATGPAAAVGYLIFNHVAEKFLTPHKDEHGNWVFSLFRHRAQLFDSNHDANVFIEKNAGFGLARRDLLVVQGKKP